ncbi:MAG: lactonase family protein [Pseudonocardiaceae bacterium]
MTRQLVFVQTNSPAGNQILAYDRAADGTLTLAETVDTGGNGGSNEGIDGDPLTSQGSLVYDIPHHLLIAVNAGSNTVSVLELEDNHLYLRQVLPSGGTFPVSVTVHGDLVYVLNSHETGAITGYRITDGKLHPIENSTRSLLLTPVTGPTQFLNVPAQIGFTPDGRQLVITTKANGSQIDIFAMADDGRPSDIFVANPSGVPSPFGFTFDDNDHLVVTDVLTSTLTTYNIQSHGTTTRLAAQPDGQQGMCWVIRAAGNFYVADAGNNFLTGFHIDPAGTPTVFTQTPTRVTPIDLVATHDGRFLYAEVGGPGGVDGFRINPDGTLTQIVTLTAPKGLQGIALT